jgi:hypothetical protein
MPISIKDLIPFHSTVTLANGKELGVGSIDPIANKGFMVNLIDANHEDLISIPYYEDGNVDVRMRGYLGNWAIKDIGRYKRLVSMGEVTTGTKVLNRFNQELEVAYCDMDTRKLTAMTYIVKFTDPKVSLMFFDKQGNVLHPNTDKFSIIGTVI